MKNISKCCLLKFLPSMQSQKEGTLLEFITSDMREYKVRRIFFLILHENICCSTHLSSQKHAYIKLTPLKPHFYIVKLEFTGVFIIFLISAQNIDCEYSLELPR